MTDNLAYYIVKTLKKFHIKVPEDVQIIGFDGIRFFGDKELSLSLR